MDQGKKRRIYKVVLTGGPCGGKTTGQSRLCTFFENLGWKVYRVPETATVLLPGGVKFIELDETTALRFQENLLLTMLQIEKTFFMLADSETRDTLVICDRGSMDPAAYISREKYDKILRDNDLDIVELRDNRYDQIIHMVSAAKGAEEFYTTEKLGSNGETTSRLYHASRTEGVEQAREMEENVSKVWIGHPYVDVIDNTTDFENKIARLIKSVCQKCGIDTGDRLSKNAKKRKFLVSGVLPPDDVFPPGYQDFDVIHNYLTVNSNKYQVRLRKRGRKVSNSWSYTHTIRRIQAGQTVEVRNQISHREHNYLLNQASPDHLEIKKLRRCFIYHHQYYQLDIYQECHSRCAGLMFLEVYTTLEGDEIKSKLPEFLNITMEVTGNPRFSMFNLSLKDDNVYTHKFCHKLAEEDEKSGSFDKLQDIPMMNGIRS